MKIVAVILARGGSKGIPNKNIISFVDRPLISWSISQCHDAGINDVYVSSDSYEILKVANAYGALPIERPSELATDSASSEVGWLHAIEYLEERSIEIEWILAPQVTSPLRSPLDIPRGIEVAESDKFDSVFSCVEVEDTLIWEESDEGIESITYDWRRRQRRQDMPKRYLENGSFYMFRPSTIRLTQNRFGGRIGKVPMEKWTAFEIDKMADLEICDALMRRFVLEPDKRQRISSLKRQNL